MTPKQLDLVRDTWRQVLPIKEEVANLFYQGLFELNPSLRSLFADDLTEQRIKLIAMLDAVVTGLSNLDALLPAVRALGTRHKQYGVAPADYDTVGSALLWTLQQGLGEAFTLDVRNAWSTAYGLLAVEMQNQSASHAA